MPTKILLLFITVATFCSCSTAYKSGQTPDDVYYSPVRYTDESQNNRQQDETRTVTAEEMEIRMCTRDRRWRDLDDEYSYHYSPYYYSNCSCSNYGYYYNPYYHPWPIYANHLSPVNATPRKVNLNAYNGINNNPVAVNPKTSASKGINWVKPSPRYNNSNQSGLGKLLREVFSSDKNNSSNSNSNSNRTYSPSTSNTSSNSGSTGSGSVTRPKRGD